MPVGRRERGYKKGSAFVALSLIREDNFPRTLSLGFLLSLDFHWRELVTCPHLDRSLTKSNGIAD